MSDKPMTQDEIRERAARVQQHLHEGGLILKGEEREREQARTEALNEQMAERLAKGPLDQPSEPERPAGPQDFTIEGQGHPLTVPDELPGGLRLDAERVSEYSILARGAGLDQADAQILLDQAVHIRVVERDALPTERASVGPWLHERIGPDNVTTLLETHDKLPPRAQAWLDDLARMVTPATWQR